MSTAVVYDGFHFAEFGVTQIWNFIFTVPSENEMDVIYEHIRNENECWTFFIAKKGYYNVKTN